MVKIAIPIQVLDIGFRTSIGADIRGGGIHIENARVSCIKAGRGQIQVQVIVPLVTIQGVVFQVRVRVDVARKPGLVREGPHVVAAGIAEGIVEVDVRARSRRGVAVDSAAVQSQGKDVVDEPNRPADRLHVGAGVGGLVPHQGVVHHVGVRGGGHGQPPAVSRLVFHHEIVGEDRSAGRVLLVPGPPRPGRSQVLVKPGTNRGDLVCAVGEDSSAVAIGDVSQEIQLLKASLVPPVHVDRAPIRTGLVGLEIRSIHLEVLDKEPARPGDGTPAAKSGHVRVKGAGLNRQVRASLCGDGPSVIGVGGVRLERGVGDGEGCGGRVAEDRSAAAA